MGEDHPVLPAEDPYHATIDQAASDIVRALLGADEPVGAEQAERIAAWVEQQHGSRGLRDAIAVLGADNAELMTVLAGIEGHDPLGLLDGWNHDERPPQL
ncbi:hypothetical protein GCM10023215_21090 [Pseudonocardia yuanmonensis]|uniref:Uncharacterized protein n=1 Tax=Pseudonocardia yuanmonensis TaxID=1095914 RepID=A0ABP8WAW3_9PSEU